MEFQIPNLYFGQYVSYGRNAEIDVRTSLQQPLPEILLSSLNHRAHDAMDAQTDFCGSRVRAPTAWAASQSFDTVLTSASGTA